MGTELGQNTADASQQAVNASHEDSHALLHARLVHVSQVCTQETSRLYTPVQET